MSDIINPDTAHDDAVRREFAALIARAKLIAADIADDVEEVLRVGIEKPLTSDEVASLLTTVVDVMRQSAATRGDDATRTALVAKVSLLIDQVLSARSRLTPAAANGRRRQRLS